MDNPTIQALAHVSDESRAALQMLDALQGYGVAVIGLGAIALFATWALDHF